MLFSIRPKLGLFRIIGALLLVFVLSGCSAIRLAYNQSPLMIHWWLDDYVDFDEAQSQRVRNQLASLQAWHRSQELPLYVGLLGQLQAFANKPVTPEQICQVNEQFRQSLQRLTEWVTPGLTLTIASLRPAQLSAIAKQFEKTNQKWRKEWMDVSRDELIEFRLKKNVDQMESFYGALEPPQLALLRRHKADSSYDARKAWAERLQRQQDWLRVIQNQGKGMSPTEFEREVGSLLKRQFISADSPYRVQFELRVREACQSIAAVHNSASSQQRQHLLHKLQDYEADLRSLMAQANKP